MQRVRLKAERNIGFSATVSARALNVEGTSFDVGHVAKVFPHSGNYKGLGSAIRNRGKFPGGGGVRVCKV
jgi:hypothetical protein